jgi:hypothetical protein
MARSIEQADFEVARVLLQAQRAEADIVAALVYRGLGRASAVQVLRLVKEGKEPLFSARPQSGTVQIKTLHIPSGSPAAKPCGGQTPRRKAQETRARLCSLWPPNPRDPLEPGAVALPERDAAVMHAGHDVHTVSFGLETRLVQKAPDVFGRVIGPHVQEHKAVNGVTKRAGEEILVLREKGHAAEPMQQRNDVRVSHTRCSNLATDLAEGNMPIPQQGPLILREVFVQQVQAAASSTDLRFGKRTGRPCGFSHASRASRTASATAASGIFPPQRLLQMNSQERPSATSSNTCQTMIRVPLNVGLPWQISGSATMYRPNSMRCLAFFMPAMYGRAEGHSSWFCAWFCARPARSDRHSVAKATIEPR